MKPETKNRKVTHTPLPYKIREDLIITDNNFNSLPQTQENAQFIITACNNHYELLAACREALRMMKSHNMLKEDNYLERIIQKVDGLKT